MGQRTLRNMTRRRAAAGLSVLGLGVAVAAFLTSGENAQSAGVVTSAYVPGVGTVVSARDETLTPDRIAEASKVHWSTTDEIAAASARDAAEDLRLGPIRRLRPSDNDGDATAIAHIKKDVAEDLF